MSNYTSLCNDDGISGFSVALPLISSFSHSSVANCKFDLEILVSPDGGIVYFIAIP